MKQLPLCCLLFAYIIQSLNHSIDLFNLLPLCVSCPALGLSLLLSSLNQSPDLILFHIFQVPLFLFVSSSSTSHKHELLCATRWLENTYIPSGTYLFLWIILILFNLISSLFWGINYWHILVLYFITNLFFFFHLPQFHYHLCVLGLTFILRLLLFKYIFMILWCWPWNLFLKYTINQYSEIILIAAVITNLVNCLVHISCCIFLNLFQYSINLN